MRTRQEIQAEAKANQRAHQKAEAAALLLLTTARNKAIKPGLSLAAVAEQMQKSVRDAVALARHRSRALGVARLEAEAAGIGAELGEAAQRVAVGFVKDWERGGLVGRSYANQWYRKAEELESKAAASEVTQGALERISVSESSEAFSSGRTSAAYDIQPIKEYGGSPPAPVTLFQLCRVWDAESGACPICADEDGRIVYLGESFPQGEPGGVHPHCRCTWTLVTLQETRQL